LRFFLLQHEVKLQPRSQWAGKKAAKKKQETGKSGKKGKKGKKGKRKQKKSSPLLPNFSAKKK